MVALRAGCRSRRYGSRSALQTLDVGLAGGGQLIEGVAVGDVFIPAGHGLVNPAWLRRSSLIGRHIVVTFAVRVVEPRRSESPSDR